MPTIRRALAAIAAVAVSGLTAGPASASASAGEGQTPDGDVRRMVYVGNNWAGTADLVTPGTFRRVARIDIVPDKAERMQEIFASPDRLAYFLAIREAIGEGHDQFVDDMYSTNDGKMLIVSRPSFADVVAISLRTEKIVWRFKVDGYRSDHMAISPDGRRVAVSASTAKVVHVLRTRDGKPVGKFASGGSPHENVYIDGGKRILHASIGMVYSPLDRPEADATKEERVFQIVDADTLKIVRRINVRKALDERGLTDVSHAVRPLTLSPNERRIYFQVSFFHGFLEMSRKTGRITRVKRLPNLVEDTPRELYLLDSAHHGIAMNPAGTRICVAGTMSDYATVVNRRSFRRGPLLKGGEKPYWVTPSADGRSCYISWSGTDKVSRISYATGRITKSVRVGDHPQRIRNGFLARGYLTHLR
jgi:DNA-binding beta-propeller fold protein YncE